MLSRRSFLRVLGLGAVVGPSLVRAALRPDPVSTFVSDGRNWLHLPPHYESDFNRIFERIMSQKVHPLASGEIQNFMGFKFIRTEIKPPEPISVKQVRESIAAGMTLDQRINTRYQKPLFPLRWNYVERPPIIAIDASFQLQRELDTLLVDVRPVTWRIWDELRQLIRS